MRKYNEEIVMTAHLMPDELYNLALDHATPTAATADHLTGCAACRQEIARLKQLASDFSLARASTPTPAALNRYQALYTHVQQQPSALRRFAAQVRAVLAWDSRQQVALQGVRSGAATSYRQLYTADAVEVELMVERSGRVRRVEGDLIADETGGRNEAALVELVDVRNQPLYAAETDGNGLFRFDSVMPGTYRMVVTRAESAAIEIEALEIA